MDKIEIELSELLSTNFIATASLSRDEITLYFVPRDKSKQFWNGNRGIVGGLEVLGELVMASEDEVALIEKGVRQLSIYPASAFSRKHGLKWQKTLRDNFATRFDFTIRARGYI
jgi:hypothetical protein